MKDIHIYHILFASPLISVVAGFNYIKYLNHINLVALNFTFIATRKKELQARNFPFFHLYKMQIGSTSFYSSFFLPSFSRSGRFQSFAHNLRFLVPRGIVLRLHSDTSSSSSSAFFFLFFFLLFFSFCFLYSFLSSPLALKSSLPYHSSQQLFPLLPLLLYLLPLPPFIRFFRCDRAPL